MAITNNNASIVNPNQVYVQARPVGDAIKRFFNGRELVGVGIGAIAANIAFPGFPLAITAAAALPLIWGLRQPIRLPVKVPQSTGAKIDPNSIKAGSESAKNAASGITCLGIDRETGMQIWEDADNDKRHHIILATTGSGKTFGLRFHMMMSLVQTTGVIAIDGKGDIQLPLDTIHLIRRFVREDDLRILNFKQGNKNVYAETGTPRTNTFNPLATGSTNYISEVLKSLLSTDDPRARGGDVWTKRAEAMCDNIAKMATYKRDHSDFKIRPGTIAKMLGLRELCQIYADEDIPSDYKSGLATYFDTLPDFDLANVKAYANGEEFKGKIQEQHGYVAMQLQPALQVLAEQYGFIFDTDNPEIDLKDVVINNRFLLVLLPAMEQSEGTLRNTGKIILAALKGMIAKELGAKFQGNISEILSERACSDWAPFKNYFDECGYYAAIPGIEILPAQGRGLGFAFYFIGQTYADLEKAGKEVADIIWGNANNKTIGKTETETTYNKISDRLGEVYVAVREGVEVRAGEFSTERVNLDKISFIKRKRLEMQDLTKLREGQYYHVVNDNLIAIQMGDPSIKSDVKEARYNQLIGLPPINDEIKRQLKRDFSKATLRFKDNLRGKPPAMFRLDATPRLRDVLNSVTEYRSAGGATSEHIQWQKAIFDLAVGDAAMVSDRSKSKLAELGSIFGKAGNPVTTGDQKQQDEPSKQSSTDHATDKADEKATIHDLDAGSTSWADLALAAANTVKNDEDEDNVLPSYDYDDEEEDPEQALETEREYLQLQLDAGHITKAEYEAEYSALRAEFFGEDESEAGDSGSIDHALEKTAPVFMELDKIGKQSPSTAKKLTFDSDQDYPSEESKSLTKKVTVDRAKEIVSQVESSFNLSNL